ncbi:MAG: SDR family NAD(P)-dependent oxidoreductase [Bacteroidales bacterium]|nr:SDR family NAD(P)-dependent oxidoreductase [Bacteroidales bacterium]
MKTIVVVGAGQGLGNHVAERFAKEDFRVVLLARRSDALAEYQKEFDAKGFEVSTVACDVSEAESVKTAFAKIHEEVGTPDVLVYNVGITTPDNQPLDEEEVLRHFKADVLGAFSCIKAVVTDEFAEKQGTILLTGGVAAVSPFPGYTCLAIDKAALRGLTLAMHNELSPRGIFVGTVMVCGIVVGSEHFAPSNIAEKYWQMYQERKVWEVRYE